MAHRPFVLASIAALIAAAVVAPAAAAVPATTRPATSKAATSTGVTATAAASGESSTAVSPPREVSAPDMRRARIVDTRAEDPVVTFLAGLPRNRDKLDQAATERSTPGNLAYRDHLTPTEAGKAYGASSKAITRLRTATAALGITATVDKGRLLARLAAPVSTWNKVYGLRMGFLPPSPGNPIRTFAMMDGDTYAAKPAGLDRVVEELLPRYVEYVPSADEPGISPAYVDALEETLADPGSPTPFPRNLGTLPPGTCNAPALRDKAVYAPGQIHTAYGTSALAARGVNGSGARLTIVSLDGGFDPDDLDLAGECFGFDVPQISIDRGTGMPSDFVGASSEIHLDLITASAVLGGEASINVLEVPGSTVAFTEAFARMIDTPQPPDAVSLSYGMCEPEYQLYAKPLMDLNEDLLRMAAIVGTTVVVAAGDNGSSMCGAEVAEETGTPTLWYPASSAWVTAVGGTRLALTSANLRRTERVWNDLPYDGGPTAPPPAFAGAGGPSLFVDRPWWQGGATPTGPRTVPDLAVMGQNRPGWPTAYGGRIFADGGTSASAPFIAASLATMSAHQRSKKYPTIGFANAWLYGAAAGAKSPFFDVVVGSNAVQLVGCCSATRGYDMASGLGVPAMDRLYATLPRPAG